MLRKITQIAKTLDTLSAKNLHFNARLPVTLHVLKKLNNYEYLVQIGTKTLQTTSHKPLVIGQKYWGQMNNDRFSNIVLSNITPQPKALAIVQISMLDSITLQETLASQKPFAALGEFVISQMQNTHSKEEFQYLGFVLLGLGQKVLNISFEDKGKKPCLLQIKGDKQILIFRAIMPTLGIIGGMISFIDSLHPRLRLDIKTNFESTLWLLEQNLKSLGGFDEVSLRHDAKLKVLFEMQEDNLLNLRG